MKATPITIELDVRKIVEVLDVVRDALVTAKLRADVADIPTELLTTISAAHPAMAGYIAQCDFDPTVAEVYDVLTEHAADIGALTVRLERLERWVGRLVQNGFPA